MTLTGDPVSDVGSNGDEGGKSLLAINIAATHRIMTIRPNPTAMPIFTR